MLNNLVLSILYAPYLTCIAIYEAKLHKKRVKSQDGDFEDDDLMDEAEDEHNRTWQKTCAENLPSLDSDMDMLEELKKRLKSLEELVKKQQ